MLRSPLTEAQSGDRRSEVERASAEGKHPLRSVQAMRGLAAVMVLLLHATEVATERFGSRHQNWWAGAAGVDIFFVISGYVMSLSSGRLTRRKGGATEFLKRRLERIVPIYWIATTLKVALLLMAPASGFAGAWRKLARSGVVSLFAKLEHRACRTAGRAGGLDSQF